MSETVKYFGYGANRDPKMISFITGRPEEELVGKPATLEGFGLGVQRLDQVLDSLSAGSILPISVRALLLESWDDRFRSYIIFPKPDSRIVGTIWELSDQDRDRVRDWELVGDWYKDDSGTATTDDGEKVDLITESLGDGQEFDHEVDGLNYETWLNPVAMFETVASKARKEYDERLSGGPEGSPSTTNP